MRIRSVLRLLPLAALLAACSSQPPLPGTKVGQPYMQGLQLYFPSYEENYDKVGQASWYGPGFNGKKTASGETFDENALTAASPTLPMPSLVRVTNLQNGRNIVVRINDRGPFAYNRIIDLSKASARKLGIKSVAQVRVQFLKSETEDYVARSQAEGHPVSMARYNQPAAAETEVASAAPAAPPEQSQIVESEVHESHAGDTVNTVAPLMSVSSRNLPPAATNLSDRSGHPVGSNIGLVQQAWADDNVTTPAPPAAKPQAEASGLLIQAGAFSTQRNAAKLATRLKGIADTIVDRIEAGDKELWRVRLGPFTDEAEAKDILARVRALGVSDARIIH